MPLIRLISCNSFYCCKPLAWAFSQLYWNSLCWIKSKQLSPYYFVLDTINPLSVYHLSSLARLRSHNWIPTLSPVKWNKLITNPRHHLCAYAQECLWALTVLKLWKRPMLAGWGDSRGNWRNGFISSGGGMTGGLLRKAGTGPGRFTPPAVDMQTIILKKPINNYIF